MIGANLNADYILYGAVTIFGGSISLDVSMVDIAKQTKAMTFSKQAKEPGAVITELNEIATDINLKVFNRKPETFIAEPEVYQRPNPVQVQSQAGLLTNYRTLLSLNGEVIGISSGDVDGDQSDEVVIIYDHAIEIFESIPGGRLKSVVKIEEAYYMDMITVDVADINRNGVAEIFVSRVDTQTGKIKSLVVEYDGAKYKIREKGLPWYMRVVKDYVTGDQVLYAQENGVNGPYTSRKVFSVKVENNQYVRDMIISVPRGFCVTSLAMGNVSGTSQANALFTDIQGQLVLFNEAGKVEWSGDDGYGGSLLRYEFVESERIQSLKDTSLGKLVYFQPRTIIHDIGNDGKGNTIVIKNEDSTGSIFSKQRKFKKSIIEILEWNEMGLTSNQSAKILPGQITDMEIRDMGNDGKKQLLLTFIKKRNNFSSKKSRSLVIAYDLVN